MSRKLKRICFYTVISLIEILTVALGIRGFQEIYPLITLNDFLDYVIFATSILLIIIGWHAIIFNALFHINAICSEEKVSVMVSQEDLKKI